jgi:hypothetical protein
MQRTTWLLGIAFTTLVGVVSCRPSSADAPAEEHDVAVVRAAIVRRLQIPSSEASTLRIDSFQGWARVLDSHAIAFALCQRRGDWTVLGATIVRDGGG